MIIDTKIGIGIVHCQSTPGSADIGYTPVYKSDNGKWSSLIDDTGDVFRHVKIEGNTILRMIQFSKDGDGWYMCSMKPIPGRDEEYRASWVYFPSSLDLSQKDIKTIIEVAESQIKEKEFDTNKLQEVILSYKKINEDSPRYNIPATQNGYAFRDTNGAFNLYDLYGCMYQKEFVQYEWVILMDKTALTLKGNSVIDISDKKIVESHIIKPQPNVLGFVPYCGNGEFRSPIRIMEGESLAVEFRKDGYLPISKNIKSQDDFVIYVRECKKYFKKTQFVASDAQTRKPIKAEIKFCNAKEDSERDSWVFSEEDLEKAKITITAEGYTKYEKTIDLREKTLSDKLPFDLEREVHEYIFELPLDKSVVTDCKNGELHIRSQFAIKKSPIIGYKCEGTPIENGHKNKLTVIQHTDLGRNTGNNGKHNDRSNTGDARDETGFCGEGNDNGRKRGNGNKGTRGILKPNKNKIQLYALIAAIILLLIALVFAVRFHQKKTNDEPQSNTQLEHSGTDWNNALKYLDENAKKYYKKDSLEKYEYLRGVYASLTQCEFKKLVKFIDKHPELKEVDVWKELYDIVKDYNGEQLNYNKTNECGENTLKLSSYNAYVKQKKTENALKTEGEKTSYQTPKEVKGTNTSTPTEKNAGQEQSDQNIDKQSKQL